MSTQVDLREIIYSLIRLNQIDDTYDIDQATDTILKAFADYLEGIELPEKHSFDSGILSPNETAAFNEAIDQTHTIINSHVSKLRGTK